MNFKSYMIFYSELKVNQEYIKYQASAKLTKFIIILRYTEANLMKITTFCEFI